MVILLLGGVVGVLYVAGGFPSKEVAQNDTNTDEDDDFIFSRNRDDEDENNVETSNDSNDENDSTISNSQTNQSTNDQPLTTGNPETSVNSSDSSTDTTNPTPNDSETIIKNPREQSEIEKTRGLAFNFMRKIARSNQRPILITSQLQTLNSKIAQFKNSSALASNISNAQSNSSKIKDLARSKNLQPDFLATAALAKLGNQRGDVAATASGMLEVLDNLNIQIGDELADDSLVTIAAYDQGVRGEFLQMRNTMERLGGQFPNRSSEIRTIWFLKEKNAISDSQFQFALSFLAIGTITQNPKAYNVNAKALNLN